MSLHKDTYHKPGSRQRAMKMLEKTKFGKAVKTCLTPGCTNRESEGEFVGSYCKPCHLERELNRLKAIEKEQREEEARERIEAKKHEREKAEKARKEKLAKMTDSDFGGWS